MNDEKELMANASPEVNADSQEENIASDTVNEDKVFNTSVTMNASILYDYLIYHAYSGAAGILGTCFGALGIIMFLNSRCTNYLYLIFGLLLILYLPINLKIKSLQMMQMNEVYKKPLDYRLDAEGITVSQGDTTQTLEWSSCTKAVSTKQSILIYSGKNNASVFPRKQMGDNYSEFLGTVACYMDPKKVKIRY